MTELKLVSINIEGDKHWDRVLPFLAQEAPDILCVQEIYRDDIPKILGFVTHSFLANTRRPHSGGGTPVEFGMAVFTRIPLSSIHSTYYDKSDSSEVPLFDMTSEIRTHETYWHGYIATEVRINGSAFKILTTHFTWTPHGESEEYQLDDLEDLKQALSTEGEHILCGDFNIPRGKNPLANALSQGYTDNIPPQYHGSIDMEFHRTRDNPSESVHVRSNMVDYLFTTPTYAASNVRLEHGVSDHMAIVATISHS